MRNPELRPLAFLSLARCALLVVPTLAFLLGATPALAQRMDGVIYVDDIESQVRKQQAMRGTNRPQPGHQPSSYAGQPRGTAQHAAANTVGASSARPSEGQRSREAASRPSLLGKLAFKNPFSGLFGGNEESHDRVPAPNLQRVATTPTRPEQPAVHLETQPSARHAATQAASQGLPAGQPSDPFTRSEQQARGASNMPLALRPNRPEQPVGDAHFVSDGPDTTKTASSAPVRTSPPKVTNADGFVMVSDMEDQSLLGQLPTMETPSNRPSAGLPRVEVTNGATNQAVADTRQEREPVAAAAGGVASPSEVVNQHVVPTSAISPASERAVRNAAPMANNPPGTARDGFAARGSRSSRSAAEPHVRSIANPVAENPASVRQPSEKAIEVLAQASELSQRAATEQEYSQVVQLCRHAMAIESAPAAVRFASDLAGWALNRRGELKADSGQTEEALLDFEDALRLDPKRWRAIHNRGVIAAQEGRFAEAFDDFNKTLDLNPKFAKAYSNRAALFVQAGDLESALEDYRQAIDNDPDLAIAHKGRAKVCHLVGDFHAALQHFDAAMLLAPTDPIIVTYRGDLLTDMGRYSDAAQSYQQALQLDATSVVAHRNYAWLLATCPSSAVRDPQQALQLAEKSMQLTAEANDLDYDTLAAAQAASGDFDAAMASMDKALELAPPAELDNYRWRRQLYQQQRPYITEPAGEVHTTSDTQ